MAIKFAFNDMHNYHRSYRDYHGKCGLQMHQGVVWNFLEALIIMVSPVMTHWSECIWCNVLKNTKNLKFLKELIKKKKGGKKKKDDGATTEPHTNKEKKRAIIFVQPNYPLRKKRTLD